MQLEDASGNPVAQSGDFITLSSSDGTGMFFASPGSTTPITTVTTDGSGEANFFFYDTTVGAPTLTAVDANTHLTTHIATQQETVTPLGKPTPNAPTGTIQPSSGYDSPTFTWSSVPARFTTICI